MQKAVKDWVSALVDLGGRNNLIHYRDLRQGTLDLTDANHVALAALLRGKSVSIASLFGRRAALLPDGQDYEQVLRRVRVIHNKSKENFEERGLETLSLGCGLATWESRRSAWEPSAPVLLRTAALRPLGVAQDEFELALVDEMVVNPTLLQVLKTEFDCEFDPEGLLERIDGVIDEPWELHEGYDWLKQQAGRVPGLKVDPRLVLTNFAYAKLPMVRDLEQSIDQLIQHPLIAALAGDEECRQSIREAGPAADAVPRPDQQPLADEFIALDADSSQNYAINSVIGGASLIVKGPPGTGKSQTIANLITSLVARGRKVLFVAEKRAAIDAVTKRLRKQGLGELVLDLHGGVKSKKAFAQAIGHALEASRTAPAVNNGVELRDLEKRRDELNAYAHALHQRREPWDISVYDARAELIGLAPYETELRLRGLEIETIGGAAAHQLQEDVSKFAELGGFSMAAEGRPWAASPIVSFEEGRQAYDLVDDVRRHALPDTLALLGRAHGGSGLPTPDTLAEWSARVALWQSIRAAFSVFTPAVFEHDLASLLEEFAPAKVGGFAKFKASITSGSYRAARKALSTSSLPGSSSSDGELYDACQAALKAKNTVLALGGTAVPSISDAVTDCPGALDHLMQQLGGLATYVGRSELAAMRIGDLWDLLDGLAGDRVTLAKLPQLRQLETSMRAVGLIEFLGDMTFRQASPSFASWAFRRMWLGSVLDHLSLSDPLIGAFVAHRHETVVAQFQAGDHRHIETTAARVRRICAEADIKVRDEFKEQADLVAHQAGLKRRHLPIRDFVRNAPDVLLALKPCWAMSPLMVSQLLPAATYFDVVIFDEASQVTPSDAVPSILRGKQLVVAGDEKQLPPTAFFESSDRDDDDGPTEEGLASILGGTKGFQSILEALGSLLPFRTLVWHYRSRDERLIAFSNAHLYDRMLTTFAGVGGEKVLRCESVPWDPDSDTNSPRAEVERVVDLILEHARQRPQESLGVIAMGIKHADHIQERFRQRLSADPELSDQLTDFFDEAREERFFVKNLERVQGDERDAIILSIGYGRNARGDLPYRFGPLLTDGGERRLNVAVTRAKNRVTLVSSFSHTDMDPERSTAEGVKLLRQYLQYVESEGRNLGDVLIEKPALNPFEVDVRDTLVRQGLKLTAQYGSSGYWIDFAVHHPTEPGRNVLAIECDGASYHSSQSARDRDRLRQEQLERVGWRFHRIWSSEWFHDKQTALGKVMAAYERSLKPVDPEDRTALRPVRSAKAPLGWTPNGSPGGQARRGRRPYLIPGQPIYDYSDDVLTRVVLWIESDGVLRTEDEVIEEAMRVLGFQRRGRNVVARLTEAIQTARDRLL